MQKYLIPLAFIGATTLVACSFKFSTQGGTDPKSPSSGSTSTSTAGTGATAGKTRDLGSLKRTPIGEAKIPAPTPSSTATTAPTTTATATPVPTGTAPNTVAVVTAATPFGSGNPDPSGWKGTLSWLPAGTTKLPDLGKQPTAGFLFAHELNVGVRPFTEGFPGVDANRKENFAIRYEAPLIVTTEADYEFKLAADDGAVLRIDGMVIVDHDGVHDFTAKTGPVHLVTGTHLVSVDYFQTTGNVGLQLFCKKMGDTSADKICPTRL